MWTALAHFVFFYAVIEILMPCTFFVLALYSEPHLYERIVVNGDGRLAMTIAQELFLMGNWMFGAAVATRILIEIYLFTLRDHFATERKGHDRDSKVE